MRPKKAIRNIIYTGKYKNQEAVFKIYDDFRITDEPISLKIFNKVNKSNILKAPELFNYKIINSKKGWLVMERIPEQAKTFKTPLNSGEQREFLNLFLEYKKYFPKKPTRDLLLAENLSSDKFQITRLNNGF